MADMELVEVPDAGGNLCRLLRYKGLFWPDLPHDCIRGIETFKLRDDDVIVVTYPKSGTHWMWEMVRLLRAGSVDVEVAANLEGMLEDVPHEKLQAQKSPRTLNTHSNFDMLPQDVLKKKTSKIVYMTRDPRDIAVSFFHHHRKLVQFYNYKGEWKDFLPMFLSGQIDNGSWFKHTLEWEQAIRDHPELEIHVTSYEALQEDTHGELQRLAKFLGVPADEKFVNQVVEVTSFDNMRKTKGMKQSFINNSSPVMYRKGKVGDWKNLFTVGQTEMFDAIFEREMQGTKAHQLYSNLSDKQHCAHSNGYTNGTVNGR